MLRVSVLSDADDYHSPRGMAGTGHVYRQELLRAERENSTPSTETPPNLHQCHLVENSGGSSAGLQSDQAPLPAATFLTLLKKCCVQKGSHRAQRLPEVSV